MLAYHLQQLHLSGSRALMHEIAGIHTARKTLLLAQSYMCIDDRLGACEGELSSKCLLTKYLLSKIVSSRHSGKDIMGPPCT